MRNPKTKTEKLRRIGTELHDAGVILEEIHARRNSIKGGGGSPSDIEAALQKHPLVHDLSVTERGAGPGKVVAYVVVEPANSVIAGGMRRYRLPNKMAVV